MKMNKALKKKGQLIEESKSLWTKVQDFNCVNVENVEKRPYNPRTSFNEWLVKIDELINLKTKIQLTNQPVYKKIVRMAELKGVVNNLRWLNCAEGVNSYSDEKRRVIFTSVISTVERDELIKRFEEEISQLQDELDEFNLVTEIVS